MNGDCLLVKLKVEQRGNVSKVVVHRVVREGQNVECDLLWRNICKRACWSDEMLWQRPALVQKDGRT
eukprot:810972-Pleurochrysis_carterae.AAC.2